LLSYTVKGTTGFIVQEDFLYIAYVNFTEKNSLHYYRYSGQCVLFDHYNWDEAMAPGGWMRLCRHRGSAGDAVLCSCSRSRNCKNFKVLRKSWKWRDQFWFICYSCY